MKPSVEQLTNSLNTPLDADIEQRLDAARTAALRGDASEGNHFWQPALAMSLAVFTVYFTHTLTGPLPTVNDAYTDAEFFQDLEILMLEEELDFISELEPTEWVDEENYDS